MQTDMKSPPAAEPSLGELTKRLAPPRPPAEPTELLSRSLATLALRAGYQTQEQQRQAEEREAREMAVKRMAAVRALRATCGVYPRYERANLDDTLYPAQRLPRDELDRYLAVRDELRTLLDAPGIVVLSGDNGPGKSHLASALVYACCDLGKKAKYVRASDFFLSLKSTFGEPGRTQEDLVRRFEAYHLLAVDEIEVRSDSNWENVVLRSLIDARYAMCASTVLITNKTKAELNGEDGSTPYLSRALRDRIRQEGGILECRWRSLRGEAGR